MTSIYNFIKLSFREGFSTNFVNELEQCLKKQGWVNGTSPSTSSKPPQVHQIKLRSGIVGIERSLQEKQKATDENISVAFQDLSKLMEMANNMVLISRNISTKIKVMND